MPSSHLILYSLLLPPSIFPSIRVFSNESVLCFRWPKDWSFSFSISPSNEYPGLISFRMDSLDLLAVQGTLKSLLQHHSSKASILRAQELILLKNQYYVSITCFSSSVQWLSHVRLFATPWTAPCQASCSSATLGACLNLCPLSQ